MSYEEKQATEEADEEAKEAERDQWRTWLLRQEHRLAIENWLRERLLTEREHNLATCRVCVRLRDGTAQKRNSDRSR
jgi:hypothetical protein